MELKPTVRETLSLIVQGRVLVTVDHKRHLGELEELDGQRVRDPEFPDRKLLMPGVYTLFEAGYLDQFGAATEAGRAALSTNTL